MINNRMAEILYVELLNFLWKNLPQGLISLGAIIGVIRYVRKRNEESVDKAVKKYSESTRKDIESISRKLLGEDHDGGGGEVGNIKHEIEKIKMGMSADREAKDTVSRYLEKSIERIDRILLEKKRNKTNGNGME